MGRKYLQVALDFKDLNKALKVARLAYMGGADVLEAGTPLIKSVGMRAIKALRREFPEALILADMKTMDVSELEVEMVWEAGGDITTILGAADNSTILKAVETGKKLGVKICVDMIGVKDPVSRGFEVAKFGVDIIGLHIGIDVQRSRGVTAETLIREVKLLSNAGPALSVAGGLNEKTVGKVAEAGATFIVVGSAITRSVDPLKATRSIKKSLGV